MARLAIIGAGPPKGAAIAAKAAALRAANHRTPPPHIDLYDQDQVGGPRGAVPSDTRTACSRCALSLSETSASRTTRRATALASRKR